MRFKLLIILLLMAVSFQSIASVYDIHQSHQSGVEHLEFEHEHEELADIEVQDDLKSFDCHHCCHCHGGQVTSLLPALMNLSYIQLKQAINILEQSFKSNLISRLLRPPQS